MGNECTFAHTSAELRDAPSLVRTELCYQFRSKGQCSKGAACTFAHGKEELRLPVEGKKEPVPPALRNGSHCGFSGYDRAPPGSSNLARLGQSTDALVFPTCHKGPSEAQHGAQRDGLKHGVNPIPWQSGPGIRKHISQFNCSEK